VVRSIYRIRSLCTLSLAAEATITLTKEKVIMKVILTTLIISILLNMVLAICLIRDRTIKKIHNPCGCSDCMDVYIEELRDIFPQLKKVKTEVIV
jgi:hypothetical protein